MMNGTGTYYYQSDSSGYKLTGEFLDNKPNGTCKYYTSSDKSYETTWSDGKCVKLTE